MGELVTKYQLDLDEAWKRTLRWAARDAKVPDILRWQDHALAWESWKEAIIKALDGDAYTPGQAYVVEEPKDGFAVRPFAVLPPIDHVIYEAVVGKMVGPIDAVLSDAVFSSRVREVKGLGNFKLHDGRQSWLKFQEAARELYEQYDEAFMLTTDVASYFDSIDIRTLIAELQTVDGIQLEDVRLLGRILNSFESGSDIWGLPQGPEASFILGNFYLLAVDRCLDALPVRLLRYQDDMKVFGDSEHVLRRALRDVIGVMRNRRLSIAVRKTKLLRGAEILTEVEDTKKDAIQYGLEHNDPAAPEAIRNLFDEAVQASPISGRDMRFAVYRLQQLNDPHGIPWILDHLSEVPNLAQLLVDYLSSHLGTYAEIEPRINGFLVDTNLNLYPFVEMQLIRMFANAATISDGTLQTMKAIASDGNKEGFVREHAYRAIGRHARPGDVAAMKTQFNKLDDRRLRRALAVAITDAAKDKAWLNTAGSQDSHLAHTCNYLKAVTTIPAP